MGVEPLLRVRGLTKHFPMGGGAFGRVKGVVRAVKGIDLDIARGETLGLVGETGCGKSTAARAILRLIEPSSGAVHFDGEDVLGMDRDALGRFRRRAQIIFQDPYGSLNPRMTAGAALDEVLRVHRLEPDAQRRRDRVMELLGRVGLEPRHADRFPHEFSGGQRQRIGIARALAVEPELIICDEPVSALDVSVQAQVINLLADLQKELGLTYLFIAHDLAVVEHVSDRVAVMYLGRIVEVAPVEELYRAPQHPYTRALLSAVPRPKPGQRRGRQPSVRGELMTGDGTDSAPPESGCAFFPRCPHPLRDAECTASVPSLTGSNAQHQSACFKEPQSVITTTGDEG